MRFEPNLSSAELKVKHKPFECFQVEEFLPEKMYGELLETFPDDSLFTAKDSAGKQSFTSRKDPEIFNKFCAENPQWALLVEGFSSDLFIQDMKQIFYKAFVNARPRQIEKKWKYTKVYDPKVGRFSTEQIGVQFQFSKLYSGAYLQPHSDGPSKYCALLLYFPDKDWKTEYGGGTSFYKLKKQPQKEYFKNNVVSFDDVEEVMTAKYMPNKLVGFIKSKNSYHAVSPVKLPPGISRKVLCINIIGLEYYYNSPYFLGKICQRIVRKIQRNKSVG